MLNKEIVLEKLESVLDPELGVSIVDLGLIYNVKVEKGEVNIIMTLTSPYCPLFPIIKENIKEKLKKIRGVKNILIKLSFDPPWSPDKMTKDAKLKIM